MARSAASGWACGVWRAAIRSILEVGTPSHDMEKRIFAAVLISIGLLWLWAAVAPKLFPELAKKPAPPKPAVTATTATTATTAPPPPAPSVGAPAPGRAVESGRAYTAEPVAAAAVGLTTIDTPNFTARLSNRGAELVSFQLKHYTATDGSRVELVKAREPSRTDYPFSIEAVDGAFAQRANAALYAVSARDVAGVHVVDYRWSDGRSTVTKTFRFTNEYLFDFNVTVTPPAPYRVTIGP